MMITLKLPWPPSVNHYWFRNRDGGMRIGEKGIEFRIAVHNVLVRHGSPHLTGRLAVDIAVFPPDKRRRDLDNILKAVCDALQHGKLYKDDNQIDRITVGRSAIENGGGLMVWVREI